MSRSAENAVTDHERFQGLSKRAFQFLRELKSNNDREWFRERKHVYEEELRRPAEALLRDVASAARKRGFLLYPKDKNPLTRIYRDIRFRADKTPFQTHVGGTLRGSAEKRAFGEVYVHITFDEPFVAAGFWMPERPFLHAWRERMAGDPKEFVKVLRQLEKGDAEWLEGYSLKRLPRGFERQAGMPLESYFKRQVYIVKQPLSEREFHSPAVIEKIATFAVAAKPLLEYGWRLKYSPKRDILDAEAF